MPVLLPNAPAGLMLAIWCTLSPLAAPPTATTPPIAHSHLLDLILVSQASPGTAKHSHCLTSGSGVKDVSPGLTISEELVAGSFDIAVPEAAGCPLLGPQ